MFALWLNIYVPGNNLHPLQAPLDALCKWTCTGCSFKLYRFIEPFIGCIKSSCIHWIVSLSCSVWLHLILASFSKSTVNVSGASRLSNLTSWSYWLCGQMIDRGKALFKHWSLSSFSTISNSPVGWGCRIHLLHLCREVRHPLPNECPGYNTKQPDGEAPVLELWGMWSTSSLPLLSGPLC